MKVFISLFLILISVFSLGHPVVNILEQAALDGDLKAQKELGRIYLNGELDQIADNSTALKWYLMAARQGDFESKIKIVDALLVGRPGEEMSAAALEILKELAASGDPRYRSLYNQALGGGSPEIKNSVSIMPEVQKSSANQVKKSYIGIRVGVQNPPVKYKRSSQYYLYGTYESFSVYLPSSGKYCKGAGEGIIEANSLADFENKQLEVENLISAVMDGLKPECDKVNARSKYSTATAPPEFKRMYFNGYVRHSSASAEGLRSASYRAEYVEGNVAVKRFYWIVDARKSFSGKPLVSCQAAQKQTGITDQNIMQKKLGLVVADGLFLDIHANEPEQQWEVSDICEDSPFAGTNLKVGDRFENIELIKPNAEGNGKCGRLHFNKMRFFGSYQKELSDENISRCKGIIRLSEYYTDNSTKKSIVLEYNARLSFDSDLVANVETKKRQQLAQKAKLLADSESFGTHLYKSKLKQNHFSYDRARVALGDLKARVVPVDLSVILSNEESLNIGLTPHVFSFSGFVSNGKNYSADDIITLFNYHLFWTQISRKKDTYNMVKFFSDDSGDIYIASLLYTWYPLKSAVFTIEKFDEESLEVYKELNKNAGLWIQDLHNNAKEYGYDQSCIVSQSISLAFEAFGCESARGQSVIDFSNFLISGEIPPLDNYFYEEFSPGRPVSESGVRFYERIERSSWEKAFEKNIFRIPLASKVQPVVPPERYTPRELNRDPSYWRKELNKAYYWQIEKVSNYLGLVYVSESDWGNRFGIIEIYEFLLGKNGLDYGGIKHISDVDFSIFAAYFTTKHDLCPKSFKEPPKAYQFSVITTKTTKDGWGWIKDRKSSTETDDLFYIDKRFVDLFDKSVNYRSKNSRGWGNTPWRPNTFYSKTGKETLAAEAAGIFKTYGCDSAVTNQIEENMYRYLAGKPSLQDDLFPSKSW